MNRREFLGYGFLAALAATGADAFLLEPDWLQTSRHTVRVPQLPQALEGVRFAQVTDVHLKGLTRVHSTVLREIKAHECRWVFLTGDVVDNPAALDDVAELCAELARASTHVIATFGNWEHWSGVELSRIEKLYRDAGVSLLVNETLALDGISIAGTDDGATGRADVEGTLARLQAAPVRILLTHAPGVMESLPSDVPRLDLTLCGHTHGGQIQAWDHPLILPSGSGPFAQGFYATPAGQMYVCRGIGMSILPARFMCRPELAIFELRRA